MVEVNILYSQGEEEKVREIMNALEDVHRRRFFFTRSAYEKKEVE